MGSLLIRNLDDAVISKLRQRAAANGNSMEEEARQTLAKSVGTDVKAWLEDLEKFRATLPPMPDDLTSVDLIAEGRREREREIENRPKPPRAKA